ncbi:MAG: hypothetical protein R2726_18425 [Acidimicrobiales bacterium]
MSDTSLPPESTDDELVSAVLDGEASDDERACAAGDPALRARLAELTRARDAVAAAVPVDDATRDATIAAALAVHTPVAGDPATGDQDAPVVALHRSRNRALVALSVAAVAVLAVVVPLAISRAGRSQTNAASAPVARGSAADRSGAPESQALGEAEGGAPSAAAGAAPSTTATALPRATIPVDSPAVVAASFLGDDLGSVADAAGLRERVAARFQLRDDVHADDGGQTSDRAAEAGHDDDQGAPAASPSPPGTFLPPEAQAEIVARLQACDPQVRSREPGLGVVLFTAAVSYDGVPALTFLYDGNPDAANRLVTVDRLTCATLDVQPSPR